MWCHVAETKKRNLDLFALLNNISKKDVEAFDRLTEQELREFQPYVIMRWLTGTESARQVFYLNTLANPFVWTLPKHKKLLYYLLTTCTSGKPQRYQWIKAQAKSSPRRPTSVNVVKQYCGYSSAHAVDALNVLTVNDIIEYATDLGYQKEDIAKIKKEWKNG